MKPNMGTTDRLIRVAVAVLIAALIGFKVVSGVLAIVLGVFAGVFVLTSLISFCPLYTLVGVNTCTVKK